MLGSRRLPKKGKLNTDKKNTSPAVAVNKWNFTTQITHTDWVDHGWPINMSLGQEISNL